MIDQALFSNPTLTFLQSGMDASMMRHDALANNIANVNTPHFQRSDVSFASLLDRALDRNGFEGKKTHERHLDIGRVDARSVRPSFTAGRESSMRNDGNNVDTDFEMAELAKNQILYRALTAGLEGELGKVSSVIKGAGRA